MLERIMSELNSRKFYNLFVTNEWDQRSGRPKAVYGNPVFRGTPKQINAQLDYYRRVYSGSDWVARLTDSDGNEFSRTDLENHLFLASCR